MTYTSLVTRFVRNFQTHCTDADTVTVLTAQLNNWEGELKQHFTGKSKSKQSKSEQPVQEGGEVKPKRTNWQAVWTSNDFGCRGYPMFAEQLKTLESSEPKHGRFENNKLLKVWAHENNLYEGWQQWARDQLTAKGLPVPSDGKSDAATVQTETAVPAVQPSGGAAAAAAAPSPAAVAPAPTAAPKPRGKVAKASA